MNWEIGTEINIGLYPQGSMAASPITWLVLQSFSDKALIVSKKILVKKPFDSIWYSSDLRRWLNTSFYDAAFSESEKSMIIETVIMNNAGLIFDNNWDLGELPEPDTLGRFETVDDPPTRDRIFLLDIRELLIDPFPYGGMYDSNNLIYTIKDDIRIPFSELLSNEDDWWVRNRDYFNDSDFGYVEGDSSWIKSTTTFFSRTCGKEIKGIRPAMWIKK